MSGPKYANVSILSTGSASVALDARKPACSGDRDIGKQIRILCYALELKDEPALVWRLYQIYRMNGISIPDELSRQLDHLADRANQGAAAIRADDAQRRAIALLEYADAIEDGERPTHALLTASERSGISTNAIKTMASRLRIRTRPYRVRSGSFDDEALRQASDPFGLAREKINESDNVARTRSRSNIAATVDSIHDPPDMTRIKS